MTSLPARERVRVKLALTVCVVALTFAPGAAAHVLVTPTRFEPGEEATLVFSMPDEQTVAAVALEVTAPAGLRFAAAEAKPGWRVSATPARVVWRGRLEPRQLTTFAVDFYAPQRVGDVTFFVRERYADGRESVYRPVVQIAEAPTLRTRDTGARTLGKAALFVAIAAGALAVGAGFLALYTWLRSPSSLQDE
jgi:hypothetical protein